LPARWRGPAAGKKPAPGPHLQRLAPNDEETRWLDKAGGRRLGFLLIQELVALAFNGFQHVLYLKYMHGKRCQLFFFFFPEMTLLFSV
jgi:hypothetical protein